MKIKKKLVVLLCLLCVLLVVRLDVFAATPRFSFGKAYGPFDFVYTGVPGDVFVGELRLYNKDTTRSITVRMASYMEGKQGWLVFQGGADVVIPPGSVAGKSYVIQIPDDDPIDPCEREHKNIIFMHLIDYDGASVSGVAVNAAVAEKVDINVVSGIVCTPGYVTPGLFDDPLDAPTFESVIRSIDPNALPPGGGGGPTYYPPIVVADTLTVDEDGSGTVDVLANDVDPDGVLLPGSVTVISGPDHGSVSIDPVTGEITYTPDPGFFGGDFFEYRVSDNDGFTGQAGVTVTVDEEGTDDEDEDDDDIIDRGEEPLVEDDVVETDEDVAVEIDVLANDSDPDGSLLPATVAVTTQPEHGTITNINLVNGEITYRPDLDYFGSDSFVYRVFDDSGLSDNATVSITVNEVEDLIDRGEEPVVLDDGYTMDQEGVVTIDPLANDYDPDGFLLPSSLVIISGPAHGTITNINPVNGVITYEPDPGYFGEDTIVYRVYDDSGLFGDGTITVEVLEEPPEPAFISIVAHPEKRVPSTGNWTTRGVLSVYRSGDTTRDAVYTVTTSDLGEADIESELTSGTYTFAFKGLSHLTTFLRNVEIEEGEDVELDFTRGNTYGLLAGDVSAGKDDYVGSLDIAATVVQLYQNNEHADLNRDFTVNAMDLGIEFFNLYKFGETI